jgi:hypothetical protein
MHISNPVLMVVTTGIALLLSIAGLVVSIAAIAIIVIGLAGGISLGQRLGSYHTYQLNGQATIRIDNFVLTVSYPSNPESMVDLNLLSADDQKKLLDLLHQRWVDAQQVWNPELGAEIAFARQLAERRLMIVA